MDLYHRKINAMKNTTNKSPQQYKKIGNNDIKDYKKAHHLNDSYENLHSRENILNRGDDNENKPKRKIQYVIQLGKNRPIPKNEEMPYRVDKSASPQRGMRVSNSINFQKMRKITFLS